jgi:RND superfamily putative drug exporter
MVLVPSIMQLLGEANWWFPRWLDRFVPRLEAEAGSASPASMVSADHPAWS